MDLELVFDDDRLKFELDGILGEYLFLDDHVTEESLFRETCTIKPIDIFPIWFWDYRKKILYPFHRKIGNVAWGGNGLRKKHVETFIGDIDQLVSKNQEISLSDIVCVFCVQEGFLDNSHDPSVQFREYIFVSDNVMRYK